MLSPDAPAQRRAPEGIRNPRRRRRNDTETLRQPRKRSKISEETFRPLRDEQTNGHAATNGHVNGDDSGILIHGPLSVREKRITSSSYRPSKSDGSATLSKTAEYVVKQLPALPERLRNDATGSFRAFFQSSSSSHHVIATTREAALIWDYNSSIASPVPRVLNLPQRLKPSETLPLASLVTTGSSTDVGIVIVYPNTGKILLWENIDGAESITLFQKSRQAIEGAVKLMSGESIVDIIEAEHAGYLLMLSSGRLAHLTVRDEHGRASIKASILNSDGQNKSSWLGSFSQILGGGWRERLAAVNTRSSARGQGQMEVVAVTADGSFKLWDINPMGQDSFRSQIDASEQIRQALEAARMVSTNEKANIKALDFAILQTSNELYIHGSASGMTVMVLVAVEDVPTTHYALVYITLAGDQASLARVTPIAVYKAPSARPSTGMRLLVPKSEHAAFVLASDAVIIASMEKVYKNFEEELHSPPFQDVIYFQYDRGAELISSSVEALHQSKVDGGSILLFTKASGVVKIIAEKPSTRPEKQKVTAKSKIEQAIFFGTMPNNILDLTETVGFTFSAEEVESAAQQISLEILKSASEFIPEVTSSMEHQINLRTKALRDLTLYMKKNHSPLSRNTRWSLMEDAEMMAAARAMWHVYERKLKERKGDEDILFDSFVIAINERNKVEPNAALGQLDPVRQWFTKDMHRIDKLFPMIPRAIVESYQETNNPTLLAEYIGEAYEILIASLETAYGFREKNALLYGLENEPLEDGVLRSGYEHLPEVWTARKNTMNAVSHCVSSFQKLLVSVMPNVPKDFAKDTFIKLTSQQAKLVMLSCLVHIERCRWLLARDNDAERESGERIKHEFETKIQPEQLFGLAELGQGRAAMRIAEKLRAMHTLVEITLGELEFSTSNENDRSSSAQDKKDAARIVKELHSDVSRYFTTFGEEFARAFFTAQVHSHKLADLLEKDFGKHRELTNFLRADPQLWTLAWINDVTAEKDLLSAGNALMKVATKQEPNIWAKKAELSIAKLALLASKSTPTSMANQSIASSASSLSARKDPSLDKLADSLLRKNRDELRLEKIQEQLFKHIKSTYDQGIDEDAGYELLMNTFAKNAVKDRANLKNMLRSVFPEIMGARILGPEQLIDVLTLIDDVTSASENPNDDISGREFLMALKVLDASGLCESQNDDDKTRGEILRLLIWKRLFIRDSWQEINDTKKKSDREIEKRVKHTMLFHTLLDGAMKSIWSSSGSTANSSGSTTMAITTLSPAFTIPTPADTLGAGSSPSQLAHRFPGLEDVATRVAADNAKDDATLTRLIERVRVASHAASATQMALEHAQAQIEYDQKVDRRRRDFIRGYVEPEGGKALVEPPFMFGEDSDDSGGGIDGKFPSALAVVDEEMMDDVEEGYEDEKSPSPEQGPRTRLRRKK